MSLTVTHNPAAAIFTALSDGTPAGELHYRVTADGGWDMYHTQVPVEFEGMGIGSALVRAAVAEASRAGRSVTGTCWFVAGWLQRHPDALTGLTAADGDLLANRSYWDDHADEWVARGETLWERPNPAWGEQNIPEERLRLLPASLAGLASLELGCGTGYVSAWLARRGAVAVGLDNSTQQLATARRLSAAHGLAVRWVHADAQRLPFDDQSFDFAITEYGAVTWCDPRRWVPEAARVLGLGGRLVVFGGSPWVTVCTPPDGSPAERTLHRGYFGIGRTDWQEVPVDPGGVSFDLTVSEWFELFTASGFRVERFLEVQAPANARDRPYVSAAWAQEFPAEQAWVLTRAAA